MAREAMDVCLRVLKERNKTRFDSYGVRNNVLIISHITFRDCRVHIFSDNLSRTSCISSRGLVLGNCPQIQRKQSNNGTVTYNFCICQMIAVKVSQFIARIIPSSVWFGFPRSI